MTDSLGRRKCVHTISLPEVSKWPPKDSEVRLSFLLIKGVCMDEPATALMFEF